MRPKKLGQHVTTCQRMDRPAAREVNESWSMDFMADELFNGRRIRLLTLVDNFSHENLAIEAHEHIGEQVGEEKARFHCKSDCRNGW